MTVVQGSAEWRAARLGCVTASRIHDVMKKLKNGSYSAARRDYMVELVCERLTGEEEEFFVTRDMQWGIDHEEEAAQMYAFTRDIEVTKCGLFKHPTIQWALASPDRLIADDGLIEIKAPKSATHVRYMLNEEVPPEYRMQVQWQLACTGRSWVDFVSYDPKMPGNAQLFVQRITMTSEEQLVLERDIGVFLSEVEELEHAIANRMDA